jgi:hypothetical protein
MCGMPIAYGLTGDRVSLRADSVAGLRLNLTIMKANDAGERARTPESNLMQKYQKLAGKENP